MNTEFTLAIVAVIFILVGFISHRQNKRKEKIKDKNFWPSIIFVGLGVIFLGVSIFGESSEDFHKRKAKENYEQTKSTDDTYKSSEPLNNSSSSSSSKTCSWCGKSFSGTHYTHLGKMASCRSTNDNSIGKWCSMKCCSEARRSSCPTCRLL